MNTRHITQKTPLDELEMSRLLELSAHMRRQRAPLIRELINAAYCDMKAAMEAAPCRQNHGSASRMNREGPRHGHIASHRRRLVLPSWIPGGGAPAPHLRV